VQNDTEWRVLFKTLATRYDVVEAAIKARHSYDLPAIHALALEPVYTPYAAWIDENASG
jgi:periplasmic divalent cation tolerance protein